MTKAELYQVPVLANLLWNLRWPFLVDLSKAMLINLSLSRDNAVAIALAVRSLRGRMRIWVLVVGVTAATIILVAATFFAMRLLDVPFMRLVGGIVILRIATMRGAEGPGATARREVRSRDFWRAIWFVIVADLTTSTDNVLAVAAAVEGNLSLIVLALGLSIPLIVLGGGFLPNLMERWPSLVYLSAVVLGLVGGRLVMADPFVVRVLQPGTLLVHCVEGVCAVGALAVGVALRRQWRPARTSPLDPSLASEVRQTAQGLPVVSEKVPVRIRQQPLTWHPSSGSDGSAGLAPLKSNDEERRQRRTA